MSVKNYVTFAVTRSQPNIGESMCEKTLHPPPSHLLEKNDVHSWSICIYPCGQHIPMYSMHMHIHACCVFVCVCVCVRCSLITNNQQLSRASIYNCQRAASLLTDRSAHIHTHCRQAKQAYLRCADSGHTHFVHGVFQWTVLRRPASEEDLCFFVLFINQIYLFSRHDICLVINI